MPSLKQWMLYCSKAGWLRFPGCRQPLVFSESGPACMTRLRRGSRRSAFADAKRPVFFGSKIQFADPPVATSGFTLTARFENLSLASNPDTRVQVKVADVFGNTSIQEIPIFESRVEVDPR